MGGGKVPSWLGLPGYLFGGEKYNVGKGAWEKN
jgi:hypothetical protein